jgi:hypothetical protein
MNRIFLKVEFAVLFLSLFGCAIVRPIVGPDGTTNQLISCGAVEYCYKKANEICGGPYQIVNTSSENSGSGGDTSTVIKLLVKCGQ